MIDINVLEQNSVRVVLEGEVAGLPIKQRWSVTAQRILLDPGILAEARDMLYVRLQEEEDRYNAAKAAVEAL